MSKQGLSKQSFGSHQVARHTNERHIPVTRLATHAAKARRVFQGSGHMVVIDKVLEFGTRFTTQAFLYSNNNRSNSNSNKSNVSVRTVGSDAHLSSSVLPEDSLYVSGESPFPWCRPNEHGTHRCHGPFSDYSWWLAFCLLLLVEIEYLLRKKVMKESCQNERACKKARSSVLFTVTSPFAETVRRGIYEVLAHDFVGFSPKKMDKNEKNFLSKRGGVGRADTV